MPRNVRNFWLEAQVDGRASTFASGPRSRDGGFTLDLYQRDKGTVAHVALIVGRVLSDGRLCLSMETLSDARPHVVEPLDFYMTTTR